MWKTVLSQVEYNQTSIDMEKLWDSQDVAVRYVMYVFSLDSFLSEEIARATREGDRNAARTLGAFCWVIGQIVKSTQYFRKDKISRKLPHE